MSGMPSMEDMWIGTGSRDRVTMAQIDSMMSGYFPRTTSHPDPLVVSREYPTPLPGWWILRITHQYRGRLVVEGLLTGGDLDIPDRSIPLVIYHHPVEEYLREVARQILEKERPCYTPEVVQRNGKFWQGGLYPTAPSHVSLRQVQGDGTERGDTQVLLFPPRSKATAQERAMVKTLTANLVDPEWMRLTLGSDIYDYDTTQGEATP